MLRFSKTIESVWEAEDVGRPKHTGVCFKGAGP